MKVDIKMQLVPLVLATWKMVQGGNRAIERGVRGQITPGP